MWDTKSKQEKIISNKTIYLEASFTHNKGGVKGTNILHLLLCSSPLTWLIKIQEELKKTRNKDCSAMKRLPGWFLLVTVLKINLLRNLTGAFTMRMSYL